MIGGGISSSMWKDSTIYTFPGFLVTMKEGDKGGIAAMRLIQPFGDFVVNLGGLSWSRPDSYYYKIPTNGSIMEGSSVSSTAGFLRDDMKTKGNIPMLVAIDNSGDRFMGSLLYDGSRIMPKDTAIALRKALEEKLLEGYLENDQEAMLGWPQKMYIVTP